VAKMAAAAQAQAQGAQPGSAVTPLQAAKR
jgi:hypothetical protein